VKANLAIVPVASRRARAAFIRLPGQIHAHDPAWVPPLLCNRRQQISERRNPFFRHAEWQGFLALQDGRPVGRINKRYHMYEERLVAPADPAAGT